MQMYWTFNCFLGCIYTVYYIVHILFLVLNWLSNLEFRLPKKEDQVARIGVMGGGLDNSGNARKKTFFSIDAFPKPLRWSKLGDRLSKPSFKNLIIKTYRELISWKPWWQGTMNCQGLCSASHGDHSSRPLHTYLYHHHIHHLSSNKVSTFWYK